MYIWLSMLGLVVVAGAVWQGLRIRRRRRRERLRESPFPEDWQEILRHSVVFYRYLPDDLRAQLHGHVNVFLDEKTFTGAQGLELTDTIRLTIAAEACILLFNRQHTTYYPTLHTIVVYPRAYMTEQARRDDSGVVTEGPSVRLGESWTRGSLAVAWDEARREARRLGTDGNVVFHEFAHQLDQEDGAADGVPCFEKRSLYTPWVEVLGREFRALQERVREHRSTFLDKYGATNAAEFFAVVTETFFEQPRRLQREEPELYAELQEYYGVDPVAWLAAAAKEED